MVSAALDAMHATLPFGLLICLEPSPIREHPRSVSLFAFMLALITILSAAMAQTHHLVSLCADLPHAIISLLSFVLIWLYLFYVFRFVFRILPPLAAKLFAATCTSPGVKIFLVSFAVLLLAWSPYVICFAPGSDCPDIGSQITQFVTGSFTTHHPLYATFIYGAVFSFGNTLGGMNTGLLALMLLQTFALAACLALEIVELSRMGFRKWACAVALVFFAIVPVFGAYCQWLVKDSLFGACFALYVTIYIRCCLCAREKGGVPTRDLVFLLATSVAVGLLRNNGFYVVVLAALVFALVYRKKLSAGKVVLLLAAIPLILGLNQVALVATHAQKGDIREALSIPFQQTARCALEHPDDVTQAEREAIDAVLNYSDLAERYKYYISDPVKSKAKTDDKGALMEYFKAWAAQGLRHPLCYIESFLDQTFGYWSFEDPSIPSVYKREFAQFVNKWTADKLGDDWPGHASGDTTSRIFPNLANKASDAVDVLKNAPFLGLFSACGIYTLASLVLAALAFYRGKPGALIVLVPSAILLLTCLAGPLNGSTRYMLGVIAAFPVVVGAVLHILFAPKRNVSKHLELARVGSLEGEN